MWERPRQSAGIKSVSYDSAALAQALHVRLPIMAREIPDGPGHAIADYGMRNMEVYDDD